MSEWIDCKERLPTPNEDVLTFSDGRYDVQYYVAPAGDFGYGFYPGGGMDITHWQPLPEPPK